MPGAGATGRFGWLGGVGALLSLMACYGTMAALAVLSMLGLGIALDEGAWAAVIVLFALLAVVGAGLGYRRHRAVWPLVLAAVGAAAIVWVMFGSFSRPIEIGGFVLLVVGAVWDWRIRTGTGIRE